MSYELKIAFTNAQLETLFATGTNVVIAKPTLEEQPEVSWQVFKPFQNNVLSWEEEYGIYASTAPVKDGSHLIQFSATSYPAYISQSYAIEASGAISGPASGGKAGAFEMKNLYSDKDHMTLGLYATATVNGQVVNGNALSAKAILLQGTATMGPSTTVFLWLQSGVISNQVVTIVTSEKTKLEYQNGQSAISVKYDSGSGLFVPA